MQIHRYIICYIYYNMSVGCTTLLSDCKVTIVAYMFKLQPLAELLANCQIFHAFVISPRTC